MAKEIQLNNGGVAIVDDDDYGRLSHARWYRASNGYAIHGEAKHGFKSFDKMHRIVLGAEKGEYVDHIDRNKLNNQKSNLRIVSAYENAQNHPKKQGRNRFIGVQFITRMGLFQSRCRINGGDHFLGYFRSEIAAAHAYNLKARELSSVATINELSEDINTLNGLLLSERAAPRRALLQSRYKYIYFSKRSKNARGSDSWYVRIAKHNVAKFYFKTEEAAYQYLIENYTHLFPVGFSFAR